MLIIIQIFILMLFIAGLFYCRKYAGEWIKELDRKEHRFFQFYPIVDGFLTKTGLYNSLNRNESISNSLKALHITTKSETIAKGYWCKKAVMVIAILFAFQFLSLMVQLQTISNSVLIDKKYIMRPEHGEGKKEVELRVDILEEEELEGTHEITLEVKEKAYSKEEIVTLFEKAKRYLDSQVLGNNKAADMITEDLNFLTTIPGSNLTISWKPKDYYYINSNGTVHNEDINMEGITTEVTATLSYEEEKTEYDMRFHILPKIYSKEEKIQKDLMEEISRISNDTKEESRLKLPISINQYKLFWSDIKKNDGGILIIFGVIVAILIWHFEDMDLESRMKKRKEQMLLDYPEIINKFTLLINAGMTIKQAWYKIAEDYSGLTSDKTAKMRVRLKRYAYEEMISTVRELKLGVSESVAYEQYGRRIGLIPYIKFTSLITQNLKKGNKGFTEMLTREALEAFENRKETAKRLGEEAGTKLLAPMMIMLVIVFMIILIPAFMSFGI